MVNVNLWSVIVAAVVAFVLGGLWYSPLLFGKKWMKLSKMSEKDMKGTNAHLSYLGTLIISLVTAYILAVFVGYAGAMTFSSGMLAGFWVWLGFVATKSFGGVLWEKKPFALWVLNSGYDLLSLLLMAGIIAVW